MPRLIVLGAGGHAKVVLEILEEIGEMEIVGCVSRDRKSCQVLGYPILGDDSKLPEALASGVSHVFVALGDNRRRLELMQHTRDLGFSILNAISAHAVVSRRATIGMGVAIMPGAIVNVDAEIEDGAIVNTGATVDHDSHIGRCAHVAPGANIGGRVRVGEGALAGIGSRLIPGVSVGQWAVIGAGSAVIRDVPDHVMVAGTPAAVRKSNPRSSS